MFTDAQLLYLHEVLGTDAKHYRVARPAGDPAAGEGGVVVWTPPLGADERALLAKILASVDLRDFTHVEGGSPGPFRHVLRFDGAALGRAAESGGGVRWTFHELKSMLGTSAEVTARKREVWTLLRDFRREV